MNYKTTKPVGTHHMSNLSGRARDGLALTTVLWAAGSVSAQEPVVIDDANETVQDGSLPEYVVDSNTSDSLYKTELLSSPKFTQPLRDVPQTITVIPETLIKDQGATSLQQALRNVSGISLQAGEGGAPPGDNLSIRGFSARTDFYIDGIRDFGSYGRDPFNFEQIEVVKGPSSTNAGRGSTGGSVNLVTKTAKLDDFVRADVSVGTDELMRGTLDINQMIPGIEGSALRINTMYHDAMVPGRGIAENKRMGVAGSLAFGLGESVPDGSGKGMIFTEPSDTRLFLNFFHMKEENRPDYGIPWVSSSVTDPRLTSFIDQPAPVPYDRYYGIVSDFEDVTTTMGTVRFEHDVNDSFTIRDQFRVGQTDRLSIVRAPRFTGVGAEINRGSKDRDETNTILANQTDFIFDFATGNVGHEAVFGFEFIQETNERFRRTTPGTATTDLFNPNSNSPADGPFERTGAFTDADAFSSAAYLFDTVSVTEWLEVNGGLRWDSYQLDYTNVAIDGSSERLSRTDEMTSGRAGVVLKPAENGSVYFGYGTSFNPAGEGLSLSSSDTSTSNFEVDPEKSETYEIGTKWDLLDERLSLTAALFRTDKTNARTSDPADPDRVVVLEGEQRVQGFELGASGNITPDWQVFAGYVHLESEVLSSLNAAEVGQELSNTPEHSFNLWTQVDLPGGFFIGGGPQFVDSRFSNTTNNREAPAYWIWDAVAGYRVNENMTLRLNVNNIGDEEYIGRVGGGHVIPGEGRSVMFTASLEF